MTRAIRSLVAAAAFGLLLPAIPTLPAAGAGAAEGAARKTMDANFPHVWISNAAVRLKLYLPAGKDSYYVGSRFEHSGVIARAEYKGHTFFGEWQKRDPASHDHIMGTAEEFSMDDPLGFAEVEAGGLFHKIGVGTLVKKEKPGKNKQTGQVEPTAYSFAGNHAIAKPAEWKVASGKDWVQFEQSFAGERDWGWRYVKRVQLDGAGGPSFTISRELTNTGGKAIDTTHYAHNFTLIDDQPVGQDYRTSLAFGIQPKEIKGDAAEIRGREIIFAKELAGGTVWMDLAGFSDKPADNAFIVRNLKTGAAMHVTGDAPLLRMRFWATRLAACPEPFVAIKLAPGATMKWSSKYTFEVGEPGKGG